jgi:hypothetical protein
MAGTRNTQKARAAAHEQLSARANVRAARLLPVIEELKAAGITSTRGIAQGANGAAGSMSPFCEERQSV